MIIKVFQSRYRIGCSRKRESRRDSVEGRLQRRCRRQSRLRRRCLCPLCRRCRRCKQKLKKVQKILFPIGEIDVSLWWRSIWPNDQHPNCTITISASKREMLTLRRINSSRSPTRPIRLNYGPKEAFTLLAGTGSNLGTLTFLSWSSCCAEGVAGCCRDKHSNPQHTIKFWH